MLFRSMLCCAVLCYAVLCYIRRALPRDLVPYAYAYECGAADSCGDGASGEFARVLRLRTPEPLLVALHCNAAAAHLKLGRAAAARAAAAAALKLAPADAKARSSIA